MASPLKIKPVKPLAMGWIPYWNLLPLRHELLKSGANEFNILNGAPALVNRWLSEGRVSIAPCSSVCLLKNVAHEVAMPIGVAATGPVGSVYLGVRRDHLDVAEFIRSRQKELKVLFSAVRKKHPGNARKMAEVIFNEGVVEPRDFDRIPSLFVTPASATSATLTRILFRLWFGEAPTELPVAEGIESLSDSGEPVLELLIGDEALIRRASFAHIIDLGEIWYELTGLPFVFAVWQTGGRVISPYWKSRVAEAAELAQARMRVEPSIYTQELKASDVSGRKIDLASYWKTITYRLGESHMQGLILFLCLARQLAPMSFSQDTVAKLMRLDASSSDICSMPL